MGVVEAGSFVEDVGSLREHDEAVAEAFGNPKELDVVAGKVEAGPLAKVRRTGAEVDGNVPDVAGKHANQLALRLAELVMQTAQHPAPGLRLVVLDEAVWQPGGGERFGVEDLGKPTALVAVLGGAHELDVAQGGVLDLHAAMMPSSGPSANAWSFWIETPSGAVKVTIVSRQHLPKGCMVRCSGASGV